MKKKYVKPSLYIESFVLSQSIAQNCHIHEEDCTVGKPTQGDITSCGWDDGVGGITWTETSGKCKQYDQDNTLEGIGCYNNPEGQFGLFEFS